MADLPQAIHPDILPRLDPEYVAFHNIHIAPRVPPHTLPWDPAIRNHPAVPGGSPIVKVGSVRDFTLETCKLRGFTPEGGAPTEGWPVLVYFHGGGWTLGSIDTQNAFAARQCKDNQCLVVCVDYRLAPENPYPAAVEDAVAALEWVYNKGPSELHVNVQKIAVGGSSSGGNLAAIIALKASQLTPPIPILFQLLVVPVTDNTASTSGDPYPSWRECQHTPWLNVGRMMWFRHNYLPNEEDWNKWDNSPIFAPDDLLAKAPAAWVGVTELDILRDEGIAYAEKLKSVGVPVEIQQYEGAPHPIMAMDGT
ncbi:hypothetical protein SERLA73DRAFT_47021 [Serpula lacrymans var. lacrymans S7.3]|uniref:Alpha/beta hydrolase fold-3 domain-containing protein n=2 Tax=Serpula lacrymans var. lacrymans TaxID=341189 RepID=F8PK78_SERL3|nr:uncharacterized protein SERLADRAFT_365364 [Serpula lacrymans var. lacrymans S7.9]EGO03532.1 hypothetical protein SERLA73DRAFT_47021 [Serpula lacrymans var. lacrymans S7.3]EGO29344.1 hypothetical protein SERLADRAFT_365364 [Serpula lacrymans var. lacrymans S7.9]